MKPHTIASKKAYYSLLLGDCSGLPIESGCHSRYAYATDIMFISRCFLTENTITISM